MENLIEIIFHTDDALMAIVAENVNQAYILLFLFIMLETGFILFPFLPGDGLIFSAGVIAASTELNILLLFVLLVVAAVSGNTINYYSGKLLGNKLKQSNNKFIKYRLMVHVPKASEFYARHGGSAIIIGRFFPIIRTYIPFLAGITEMRFIKFTGYSLFGAVIWILLFLLTGFFVGEIKWVKHNYGIIFLFLIIVTITPFLYRFISVLVIRMKKRCESSV